MLSTARVLREPDHSSERRIRHLLKGSSSGRVRTIDDRAVSGADGSNVSYQSGDDGDEEAHNVSIRHQ